MPFISILSLPWIAIFPAAFAVWFSTLQSLSVALLIIGYCVALINGQLDFWVVIPIAALCFAAYAVSSRHKLYFQCIGHALFIVLAIALSMHWLPGFHNLRVIDNVKLTADAAPFTMYLNLDKPLVGFWLLLTLPWIRSSYAWRISLKAVFSGILITVASCLFIAVLFGLVKWEPKWPSVTWLWVLNNLLLVALTEEAFFRGYLQTGLSHLLRKWPHADMMALFVAAGLFGLAHIAGEWPWIILGSVAGIGYGLTYRLGGLQAAVLVHFGLNATHYFLFSYPRLD